MSFVLEDLGITDRTQRLTLRNFTSTFSDRGPNIKSVARRLEKNLVTMRLAMFELQHSVHLCDKAVSVAHGWGMAKDADEVSYKRNALADETHWSAVAAPPLRSGQTGSPGPSVFSTLADVAVRAC